MVSVGLLKTMLRLDEGERLLPYFDTATPPKLTIGVGRNLTDKGITSQEADILLDSDITELMVNKTVQDIVEGHDHIRQTVILDMAFNLGVSGLLKFKKTLEYFSNREYVKAAMEMLNSAWALQVGSRATRLAYMMETGEVHRDYLKGG